MNDLIDPDDLAHLVGAPFTEEEIDTAVGVLRAAADWHIAPSRDVTVTLDVMRYQRELRLPTRALTSVDEIRDMTADSDYGTVIDATTYRVSKNTAKVHRYFWPHGYGAVQVDMTHGYAACPEDLKPVIAESVSRIRRDQTATGFGAGPYTVQYGTQASRVALESPLATSSILDRYLLHQPGMV